jgi:hypothetical protein
MTKSPEFIFSIQKEGAEENYGELRIHGGS